MGRLAGKEAAQSECNRVTRLQGKIHQGSKVNCSATKMRLTVQ